MAIDDGFFMRQALDLARLTLGQTRPNPAVGCVLVQDGRIVGVGTHLRAGEPHAEVWAVRQAGEQARGATVYVTLEPCSHHGRTPPCADLLIHAGVARVVAAVPDDDPRVAGAGLERLRAAGIRVDVGVCADEARRLNEAFLFARRAKRPWVTLKAAISLDGKIATRTGQSRWISSPESREDAHLLRRERDAILVGIGTVLADDPSLTARSARGGLPPLRVLLDHEMRVPESAHVLDGQAPTLVLTSTRADPERIRGLRRGSVEVAVLGDRIDIHTVLHALEEREIRSVLVEGGATVHGSFLASGLFEEVILYQAPLLIGGKDAPNAIGGLGVAGLDEAPRLTIRSVERLGPDLKITAIRRAHDEGDLPDIRPDRHDLIERLETR